MSQKDQIYRLSDHGLHENMQTKRQDRWQTFHHTIKGDSSRQHPHFQKCSASLLPGSRRKGICSASGRGSGTPRWQVPSEGGQGDPRSNSGSSHRRVSDGPKPWVSNLQTVTQTALRGASGPNVHSYMPLTITLNMNCWKPLHSEELA